MNTTETKNTKETALEAFIERNQAATEKINIIKQAINNHLYADPDNINWANVGDISYINTQLNNILEFIGPISE